MVNTFLKLYFAWVCDSCGLKVQNIVRFKEKYELPILRGNDKHALDREKRIGSAVAKVMILLFVLSYWNIITRRLWVSLFYFICHGMYIMYISI